MQVTLTREKRPDKDRRFTAVLTRDSGEKIGVELRKHEIRFMEGKDGKPTLASLSREERLGLFRVIMAEYREHSFGDGGYKGAAIGISEDNRIFIGLNTKRQHPYFKDCAEQNMLNAVTDAISFSSMKNDDAALPSSPPKLKEVYMMGGAEPSGTSAGLAISCPCGKCVDMLADAMTSETSPVYVLPIPKEPLPDTVRDPFPFKIKTASDASLLKDINHDKDIWCVPIGYLNQHREVEISSKAAKSYVQGVKTLMGKLTNEQPELPFDDKTADLAVRIVKNADAQCKSISDLHHVSEEGVSLKNVNQFMHGRIEEAVESRWRKFNHDNPNVDKKTFMEKIDVVRVAVVQLQDGTLRYGMDVDSAFDNAMPHAEVTAVNSAVEILAEHRVQNVWVMEMRPEDVARIEEGGRKPIMHTSPKEGIERIAKRGTRDLQFHYIPFNDGTLNEKELSEKQLGDMTKRYYTHEIFPSNFNGIKFADNGNDGAGAARA